MEKHNLLQSSNNRWLALFNCVNRLSEQWTALEHFFLAARVKDKLLSADRCLETMRNPYNRAYLFFLAGSLSRASLFSMPCFSQRKCSCILCIAKVTNL